MLSISIFCNLNNNLLLLKNYKNSYMVIRIATGLYYIFSVNTNYIINYKKLKYFLLREMTAQYVNQSLKTT